MAIMVSIRGSTTAEQIRDFERQMRDIASAKVPRSVQFALNGTAIAASERMKALLPQVLDEPTPWIQGAFTATKGDLKVTNLRDVKASTEVKPEQSATLKRVQLIKIGARRAKDLADRLIRIESPGPFHLHIPLSIAAAIDTEDGRPKFFDSLLAEKKVVAAGIETWKRKSKMNSGELWDCLVGNIAVAELASRTWPKVVGRILTDMTPQPQRDRYEGENHSIMADVLAYQQTREFQGDETISILPPAGDVKIPGRKVLKDPDADIHAPSRRPRPQAWSGRPVACRSEPAASCAMAAAE